MELKSRKKCPMLNSGRIVGLMHMQSIRCYGCKRGEGCSVIYRSLPSKWRRGRSMWVMLGFEFHLCLSLIQLEFWSADCLLPSFDLLSCWEIGLLYHFSLLIRSDWIFFVFYHEGHRLAEKLLLIIFIFWQISSTFHNALILCTETPFSILKKVSAPITSDECSRGH